MHSELSLADIDRLTNGKFGKFDAICPCCSASRKPCNRLKKVLRIWRKHSDFASYHCAHCGTKGYATDGSLSCNAGDVAKRRAEAEADHAEVVARSHGKARWLWRQSLPIKGTAAERYLRGPRVYPGPIPPTLRFLPPRDGHPPAMIAAFGAVRESRIADDGTSVLEINGDDVRAVHLTKLRADGSGKAGTDGDKIIIGQQVTAPIWLSPITDNMAVAVAEGIEDGLSILAALGVGTWAAGSACRLPALAEYVPDFIETATIYEDEDEAGRRNVAELARRLLARRIEVRRANLTKLLAMVS
ncbi:toprim domain-containing protein [Bradyrhizobium septentrionale]|uniref:Toprim domain-containing protein n=1 Tax=Bradyrhizobium septentrionale TaxID=1404411 RepID=A0A973W5R2_9BRAD|nr:toprim domain-containing protein [Bradyrhizobium septentrionale]UGY16715.1 toprim domain-containing protein [Bradyrhizobium septentrionale]UGY25373.1 toprim domain-containing protein [Bradyrhizobium septentrionale]